MLFLFLILSLTLGISFVCSLLESVILSVSHAYIALLIKEGKKSGRLLMEMKKTINHPLAAILTLNTVANIIGAAGVAAQTYYLFGRRWVAVASAILTVLILVCSEIIPKTIGAAHWKKLSPVAAYVLKVLIVMLYPVVKALEAISSYISRGSTDRHVTREEILVLAEIGESEGILLKKEALIIHNLLLLTEIRTEDILTPRAVILAFQKDKTIGEVIENNSPIRFSRIPVYSDKLDDIRGFVFKNELVEAYYTGKANDTIEHLMKPLYAVPNSKSIADLLDEFINRHEHMFLVIDEYGGTSGIVTLEDVIETLLGVEIIDELDTVSDLRAYARAKGKRRHEG